MVSATGEGVENRGIQAKNEDTISKELFSCPKWNSHISPEKRAKIREGGATRKNQAHF